MIGSRICGLGRRVDTSRNAPRAAAWNALSEESTAWAAPSLITTRKPVTGNPIRRPFSIIDWKPFSTEGMNSVGIEPP